MKKVKSYWVPSIPLPIYVGWFLKRCVCAYCHAKFKNDEQYKWHFLKEHMDDEQHNLPKELVHD